MRRGAIEVNTGPTGRGTDGVGHDDPVLLAELEALLRMQSEPPAHALHAARESFTWRTVDAEIAALTYDSVLDDVTTTRSAGQPRILTFEADGLTIEVELDASPSGRRLLGQLVPGQVAELRLCQDGEVIATAVADAWGRFALPLPAARGRVSVRCTLADHSVVEAATVVV